MLKKPENYDSVELREFDYTPINLGGHKGIIKKVEEYTGQSGSTSLKVTTDTDKNDIQPSYFQAQYDGDTRAEKKYSNGAIKYVSLKDDENCVRMLKAFITAIENSNPGFKYDWNKDLSQLVNKKIGLVFGLEEYEANDGKIKTMTRLTQFRSNDKVDNVKIPKVKILSGTLIDYDEYVSKNKTFNAKEATDLIDNFNTVIEYDNSAIDL